MYLGIDIDCKLRFEDYADKIISKASQRMHIVKKFSLSALQTSGMHAYWRFCCVITDVLPTDFIHQSILQRQEKMGKISKDAEKLSLDDIDSLGTLVSKNTKNFMLQLVHDNEHFIHGFVERCPSGRYQYMKCVYNFNVCITLNGIL